MPLVERNVFSCFKRHCTLIPCHRWPLGHICIKQIPCCNFLISICNQKLTCYENSACQDIIFGFHIYGCNLDYSQLFFLVCFFLHVGLRTLYLMYPTFSLHWKWYLVSDFIQCCYCPTLLKTNLSIPWQLVLDIDVSLPSLLSSPFL